MLLIIIKVKCKIITRSSDRVFQLSQCWNDFMLQSVRNCSTRPLLFQRPSNNAICLWCSAPPCWPTACHQGNNCILLEVHLEILRAHLQCHSYLLHLQSEWSLKDGIQNNIPHTYPIRVEHPHSPLGSFQAILR